MGGTPLYLDGKPVSIGIYNALVYLKPRYLARWGFELKVRDGLRELVDQWDAWNKRQAYLNGTGPFAPVAAWPDETAPHIAGYGVDLYDTAPYPTLTVISSAQNEWLHREGKAVGLTNVGRTFGEGWHFEVPRGTQWAGVPAGGSTATFPSTTETIGEQTMSYPIKLNGAHLLHIGENGFIKHFSTNTPVGKEKRGVADLTKDIVSPTDQWIDLDTDNFLNQLDSFGIPRWVVDVNTGWVQNPATGKFESGGMWSWARASYEQSKAILAKISPSAPVVSSPKA